MCKIASYCMYMISCISCSGEYNSKEMIITRWWWGQWNLICCFSSQPASKYTNISIVEGDVVFISWTGAEPNTILLLNYHVQNWKGLSWYTQHLLKIPKPPSKLEDLLVCMFYKCYMTWMNNNHPPTSFFRILSEK